MAKLTTKKRNALPTSSFAEPGKRGYPINDRAHAQNALARVSQFGSSAEKAQVRAAVYAKFPTMGKGKKAKTMHYSHHEMDLYQGCDLTGHSPAKY